MYSTVNRRNFLRGSGALIALPALESLGFKAFAASQKITRPPKRLAFLSMCYGVTRKSFYPDKKEKGLNYKLPQGLSPLKKFQKDFTMIQGCEHKFSNSPHWGSTF